MTQCLLLNWAQYRADHLDNVNATCRWARCSHNPINLVTFWPRQTLRKAFSSVLSSDRLMRPAIKIRTAPSSNRLLRAIWRQMTLKNRRESRTNRRWLRSCQGDDASQPCPKSQQEKKKDCSPANTVMPSLPEHNSLVVTVRELILVHSLNTKLD